MRAHARTYIHLLMRRCRMLLGTYWGARYIHTYNIYPANLCPTQNAILSARRDHGRQLAQMQRVPAGKQTGLPPPRAWGHWTDLQGNPLTHAPRSVEPKKDKDKDKDKRQGPGTTPSLLWFSMQRPTRPNIRDVIGPGQPGLHREPRKARRFVPGPLPLGPVLKCAARGGYGMPACKGSHEGCRGTRWSRWTLTRKLPSRRQRSLMGKVPSRRQRSLM